MQNDKIYDPDLECMSALDRQAYYDKHIRQQVEYAYKHSAAVHSKLDVAGIRPAHIRNVKDLEKIPITHKDELIDLRKSDPPWGGLLGVAPHKLPKIFMSPGPIYDPMAAPEDKGFYRRLEKTLYAAGFRKGDIAVNTWSYHMVPSGHWYEEGLRRLGVTVIPMGTGNTELQVRVLQDTKAAGWLGTCGFFMNILEQAEKVGLDPRHDFSLRILCAGGEMGGGPMRKVFQEKYGLPSFDTYGTADTGVLAYECTEKTGMHVAEEVFVEIVDPKTGKQLGPNEIGEVVITPFVKTYPLIRFGTGDLSSYSEDICLCGRTSIRLPRIMGRIGDAVRVRGMFVHPRQTDEVMAGCVEVANYQFIVTRPSTRDEMVLKVELARKPHDQEAWENKLRSSFQGICKVKFDTIEIVPAGSISLGEKKLIDKRVY